FGQVALSLRASHRHSCRLALLGLLCHLLAFIDSVLLAALITAITRARVAVSGLFTQNPLSNQLPEE
ncbi:hypothetical protein, partial [Comamonas sp.]|uniref:hypothetical protein n=1 Tax=Comamonas sp. TaxID=34028 RepID=UPI0035D55A30